MLCCRFFAFLQSHRSLQSTVPVSKNRRLALRAAGRIGSSKNDRNTALARGPGRQVGSVTTFAGAQGRHVVPGTTFPEALGPPVGLSFGVKATRAGKADVEGVLKGLF